MAKHRVHAPKISKTRRRRYTVLGRGCNGAVLQGPPGSVYKWTTDPTELHAFLVADGLRARGVEVPGIPEVQGIWIGEREALIQRADTPTLSGRAARNLLDPGLRTALQRGARLSATGRLRGNRAIQATGWKLQMRALGSSPVLRPIYQGARALSKYGVQLHDIRPANLAMGRKSLLMIDPGRTPVEATLVARGEAARRCPNEPALRKAATQLLGRAPNYKSCAVVGQREMQKVMGQHGWSAREVNGTAGFHTEDGRILLATDGTWSQLHEMVHAAGVTNESLGTWSTEGITEASAQDIAKARQWKHVPTYQQEVSVIRKQLAPALGISVLDLGRLVAKDPKGARRRIAVGLVQKVGGNGRRWEATLGPSSTSSAAFERELRRVRSARR